MRTALIACAIAIGSAGLVPLGATAQTAPAAKPEPEFTFTGNAGLFSDYRFRGFTQTDYKPAFQGGFDFAHKSGFYLGNWNSNVEQALYNGASLEMDFYGGYKTTFGDFGLDVGVIYYYYPGTNKFQPGVDAKNFEAYIGGSYGPASLKYFYSFTDFFGLNSNDLGLPGDIDTKGSQYVDLTLTFPLDGGWAIVAHGGWQKINNLKDFGPNVFGVQDDSYFDWKLGVNYDIAGSGWIVGAAVVGTSEKNLFTVGDVSEGGGKTRGVISISKTF
jgi:uncharacterized protein (TIGR02001 family)